MKAKGTILTKEERDVLILAAAHPGGNCLNNNEIAKRLNISLTRVKRLLHYSFKKLQVNNRIEAVRSVKRRGEISLDEFYSLDELAELHSSLSPDVVRRIAYLLRQGFKYGDLPGSDESIIRMGRRQDTILTNSEREVVICVGRGLTNKEIADRLYISIGAVTTFLNRACRKLGAHNRAEAFMLALKHREILIGDIISINELLHILAPLGPEYLEEMAQLLEEKFGQESIPIDR